MIGSNDDKQEAYTRILTYTQTLSVTDMCRSGCSNAGAYYSWLRSTILDLSGHLSLEMLSL